jgi:hypothetical protein
VVDDTGDPVARLIPAFGELFTKPFWVETLQSPAPTSLRSIQLGQLALFRE